jgi:chaperone BCS1
LFASTNYPDRLDDALRRPGRFDVHVPLHDATPAQAIELYKHFYPFTEYTIQSQVTQNFNDKKRSTEGFESQEEVEKSAERFAGNVFDKEVEVSMAALQGFLLRYKKEPKKAVVDADAWSAGLKAEQAEKKRKREERRAEREARKSSPAPASVE